MDTRPYRLSWPFSCVIFDISPQSVFNVASQKLKGLCLFSSKGVCDMSSSAFDFRSCNAWRCSMYFVHLIVDYSPWINIGTGAKIGRNCNLVHVPLESIDLQAALYKKGFSGNKPSLWAIQVKFGFALYFLKFLYPIPFSILHLVSPTWRRVEGTRI